MRNSSSLDWLRFMHTPNDYRVSPENTIIKSRTLRKYGFKVHPKGIEPLSEVPETSILSIELQVLIQIYQARKNASSA